MREIIETSLINVLQAQQWEKTKGELGAFLILEGARSAQWDVKETKFDKLNQLVQDFINSVEELT